MIVRLALLAAASGTVLVGCGDDSGSSSAVASTVASAPADELATADELAPADVVIDTFIFDPNPVEVAAGSTVTFRNDDDILHTVTQGTRDQPVAEGFDEALDGVGSTAEITVAGPGTVPYFCSIHAGMDAELVVS